MVDELAPRGSLPEAAQPYRTIGPFDARTLPKGLRGEHSLKDGTWARLHVASGTLDFVWNDETGGTTRLDAPALLIVPPLVRHHVDGNGPFELTITFLSD